MSWPSLFCRVLTHLTKRSEKQKPPKKTAEHVPVGREAEIYGKYETIVTRREEILHK